jgi:transaldolase
MGASFRNTEEILELAGCDLLTISPQFLQELQDSTGVIDQKLDASKSKQQALEFSKMDEKTFRLALNNDAMATEKLAEGIRNFAKDAVKLENMLRANYRIG